MYKAILYSLFFLCSLLSSLPLCSLYMGNPSEPILIDKGMWLAEDSLFTLKLGLESNYTFNRRMESYDFPTIYAKKVSIFTNQGRLQVGFLDRVAVYGSMGSLQATFQEQLPRFAHTFSLETNSTFTYGGGITCILSTWDKTTLGFDGKIQYARPKISSFSSNGINMHSSAFMLYHDYQFGLALSYQTDLLIPYIGVKYSYAQFRAKNLPSLFFSSRQTALRSKERVGLVVGFSLAAQKAADLTLEMRFFDETSLAGNLNWKF